MTQFIIRDDIKMLRETLCLAQHRISSYPYDRSNKAYHMNRLQRLIDECDRHRPLGSDGKHGRRHTETCGCEDKGDPETWQKPEGNTNV